MKSHFFRTRRACAGIALVAAAAGSLPAMAQSQPELPAHQLSFGASASLEVPKDLLTVSLQVVRDGSDAAAVQAGLKQVLDAALTEAKRQADGQAMSVRTDGFSISPRYGRDGKPSGWAGSAGLTLEGRDIARVAATVGRLQGMNIVGTGYSISRETREQHEAELTAQAIRRFRERAAAMAQQFGYSGYVLREVSVQTSDGDPVGRPPMVMMARAQAMAADAAPLPTEGGKGLLSATVQGSVTLTR
jgi:predicted secreted protein